jgi:antitoxin ParD1/3/4
MIHTIPRQGARMAHNTSISLGSHFTAFIDAQVSSGRYASASEVVRAGLRMLESHESQVRALQEALKAGEESGAAVPFDPESFLERMRASHVR